MFDSHTWLSGYHTGHTNTEHSHVAKKALWDGAESSVTKTK